MFSILPPGVYIQEVHHTHESETELQHVIQSSEVTEDILQQLRTVGHARLLSPVEREARLQQ